MGRKNDKKEPSLINLNDNSLVIKGETCFGAHKECKVSCEQRKCRYYQDMSGDHENCIINAADAGPLTLQQVGDIFKVTRMRICQIEKIAKQVLKNTMDREQH